jgi:hypothetical protein
MMVKDPLSTSSNFSDGPLEISRRGSLHHISFVSMLPRIGKDVECLVAVVRRVERDVVGPASGLDVISEAPMEFVQMQRWCGEGLTRMCPDADAAACEEIDR